MKYLRSKVDGHIYNYNPYLAERHDMEEVDESEVTSKKQGRKKRVADEVSSEKVAYTGPAI